MPRNRSQSNPLLLINHKSKRILQPNLRMTEHTSEGRLEGVWNNPNIVPPPLLSVVWDIIKQHIKKLFIEVAIN